MSTKNDSFTAEEREIIAALRCCPDSVLGQEFPPYAELSLASVAALQGIHPATARRLLRRGLENISLGIGSDDALCRLIALYYNKEEHSQHNEK